ncbi:MAG: hypothetical protein KDA57_08105 [Planctomycetales bacterium]|nr:hypothetical protein [Planctomycetales bacterium]
MLPWQDYLRYRVSPLLPNELRHGEVVRIVESLRAIRPDALQVSCLGESVEGREISLLTLGSGSRKVLAWSQMHGDEPTHTAALLDLINFLQRAPEHPTAESILAGCTLHMIVMLNPDGAEAFTRRNAQHIDVNRDALHLQTPEGRILRDAVNSLRPGYALNLHNQRPRTTVGQSQQVASFSVLVPPIDEAQSVTDVTRRAKQLASCVARAVADRCPGQVSRYKADYMPRCFGEWVQQQGVVTVTIEAGGWSSVDAGPLVQLHFFGLVAGLESIATEELLEADPGEYDALPETGEHDLFDSLLRNVLVLSGLKHQPFRTDLSVNFRQIGSTGREGAIVDLGDLHVTNGKTLIDGSELTCLPGRIVWRPEVSPSRLPDWKQRERMFGIGVTTVLGQIDLAEPEEIEVFAELRKQESLPINVGFLIRLNQWSDEMRDQLLYAVSLGVLGVVDEDLPTEARHYLQWFGVAAVSEAVLRANDAEFATLQQCAEQTRMSAQRLGLVGRGAIRLGAAADLVLVKCPPTAGTNTAFRESNLQQVVVGGNVAFDRGKLLDSLPGVLLTSRLARS